MGPEVFLEGLHMWRRGGSGKPGRGMTWAATWGKNAGLREQCKVSMASCGGKYGPGGASHSILHPKSISPETNTPVC